ncbi:MAG TPA: ShlB/FhaC/HecB family hemolysin secretion/activation protein, partial [Gemmatimonadaceae bacterium]|nr:ShlB/FhaC/HecB family hemolysin secretion/activation protein [Gemmatimonadaceae bacterium]
LQLGVFRRLAVSNDWGNPLGFGSSLSALLFGRDEGFYYYTWGAELVGTGEGNPFFTWRLFAEHQNDADVHTQLSLARAVNNKRFLWNVDADAGTLLGSSARVQRTLGSDPNGLRLLLDARGEGGAGDFAFTRGLLDATLSSGLGRDLAAAVTGSAGSSTGDLPAQRQFFLGGPQSVRGQWAGTMHGDAFWMTRAELGTSMVSARPTIYADLGWAGARANWQRPGRVMSGVGAGASLLDGLMRFDVAHGLSPVKMWRADLYVEARF